MVGQFLPFFLGIVGADALCKEAAERREANKALVDFLQERWKGVTPVLWGQGLRQVGLNEGIYLGLLGLDKLPPTLSGANQARLGELETEGYFELAHEEDKPQGHGEHREK